MKCQHCGEETFLPFKCPFCKGYYCAEHRLPENHTCPEYWRVKIPRREPLPVIIERAPQRPPYEYARPRPPRVTTDLFWFSLTELKHLSVGVLLVMGVGMSMFLFTSLRWLGIGILGILAAVFTAAFLLHELAHKFVAQHHGLWAEFRLTKTGALITLFSIFFPFKLISPGAVMVGGVGSIETLGKISLAGPLTNLFLSVLFCGIIQTSPSTTLFLIAGVGGVFNALIALYNLIPFGLLDGQKIFRWNKMVWGTTFALSIALFGWFLPRVFPLIY